MIGKSVAHYKIASALGAGGMGEVYRATDTKLGREVALKVLPAAFANDTQRMARFQREAQVLASLNHPNIASIYGLEESGTTRALVMELVEGPTLAELLETRKSKLENRKSTSNPASTFDLQFSTFDPLHIAKQIAEALEYAHEKSVVHRDLKPANIKITPEGVVKVLDFGLAKALDTQDSVADISNSPTMMTAATQAGMILGTAAYMSPEQARGRAVDRRTDIWAFGVVLYEMLTGRRAFEGETTSDLLAAVLKSEPDWNALPAETPPPIRKLLRRCLEKTPKLRLRDIGDARMEIDEAIAEPSMPSPTRAGVEAQSLPPVTQPIRRTVAWISVAALVALAAVAGVWFGSRWSSPPPQWSGELLAGPTIAYWPRVSPDAHLIAFQAMVDDLPQVAVLDPASGNWTVLTHNRAQGTVSTLYWSRDGSKIYFDRYNPQPVGIFSVPTLGGEERLMLANAASPEPLPDGTLLIVRVDPDRTMQIYHFWPDSGRLQALGAWLDVGSPSAAMRVFPDGKEAVFFGTVKGTNSDNLQHLYTLDIATGSVRRLAPALSIIQTAQLFPLGVTLDGKSVLIDLPSGNLHRIEAIPRSGAAPIQTLMTLTSAPWSMDPAPDGSLYIDQIDRPLEILRFPVSGGTPEVLASTETYPYPVWIAPPVEFSDGRLLLPTLNSGRPRMLLGTPGGNFSPLLETQEETTTPMARVGSEAVALMVGSPPARALAIASVKEGRIIRRFEVTEGKQISALAASPDGESLYYVSSGSLWSIPSKGGTPRMICAADGVAVDPDGKDLIVQLDEQEHVHLVRVPLSGGPQQEIRVRGQTHLNPNAVGPNSVNKDGKALVGVESPDSWFFKVAILDLATGELKGVPLNYAGDNFISGWTNDGRIIVVASPMRSHLWRFRPMR